MSAVEQIQKQYACASAVNNREMKLESFGFFLKDYVIQGAEIQLDQNNPRRFTITEGIVSFADGLWRVYADTVTLPRKAATYFVAFTLKAGYVVNDEYPQDEYLPLWQINTDATGNITGAVDLRGDMGYVKFRDEIQGIITDQVIVDEEHIAPEAVGTTRIQDKAVTEAKLDDESVSSRVIQDDAVRTFHILDKAVTYAKLGQDVTDLIDAIQSGDSGAAANAARYNSITEITYPTLKQRLDTEYAEVQSQFVQMEQQTNNKLANKVDKGGNEQITWGMLDQETKLNITGGNTPVVGVDAVNTSNIVDNAVTRRKRTKLGEVAYIIPPFNAFPDYDTNTKTLDFKSTALSEPVLVYGNERYPIPVGTTISCIPSDIPTSTTFKLYFDTSTQEFLVVSWNYTNIPESCVLVATGRNHTGIMSIGCPYTINGKNAEIMIHDYIRDYVRDRKNIMPLYHFEVGSIYPTGDEPPGEHHVPTRMRSEFITLKKGDRIRCNDPNTYKFGGHIFAEKDMNTWIKDIGWQTSGVYVAEQDCYYRMVAGTQDDRTITPEIIEDFVETLEFIPYFESGASSAITTIDLQTDVTYSSPNHSFNPTDNSVRLESSVAEANYLNVTVPIDNAHFGVVEFEARMISGKIGRVGLYRNGNLALAVSIDTTYYKPYSLKIPFDAPGSFTVRIGSLDGNGTAGCDVKNMIIKVEEFPAKQNRSEPFLYIAHRGDTVFAPENTMPAFISALRKGFACVETDIEVTADNEFVLLHDSTIDRTSNGTGNVNSYTLAQLRQFDFGSWKGAKYAGTPIPTMKEFLIWCRTVDVRPFLELKTAFNSNLAMKFVDEIKEVGMWDRVDIISFNLASLQAIAAVDNTARFALIGTVSQTAINNLKALGPNVYFSIYGGDLASSAALCKANGLEYIFSTNDGNAIRQSIEVGCFGVCTDMLNLAGCYF